MLQNGEAAVSDAADATGDALEAVGPGGRRGDAEAAGDAISEETTELAVEADAAVEGAGDAVEAETAGTTTMVPLEDAETDTADAPLEGDAMVEETEAAEVETTDHHDGRDRQRRCRSLRRLYGIVWRFRGVRSCRPERAGS